MHWPQLASTVALPPSFRRQRNSTRQLGMHWPQLASTVALPTKGWWAYSFWPLRGQSLLVVSEMFAQVQYGVESWEQVTRVPWPRASCSIQLRFVSWMHILHLALPQPAQRIELATSGRSWLPCVLSQENEMAWGWRFVTPQANSHSLNTS